MSSRAPAAGIRLQGHVTGFPRLCNAAITDAARSLLMIYEVHVLSEASAAAPYV